MSNKWEEIIKRKIEEAKARGAKKRGWIKLDKSWLTSSINYRFTLEEKAIFSDLLIMADEYGPVPGLISDNDFRPMPHDYLAHQSCCTPELFETTLKKGIEDDSIYENSHGIFLTHFDDYQFTEYDRQKPYRQAKKDVGRPLEDPDKYINQGKYSHMVCRTAGDVKRLEKIRKESKARIDKGST